MSYLYVAIVSFTAGLVLDALYQHKIVRAVESKAEAFEEMIVTYRNHLSEIVTAIRSKL